MNDPVVVRTQHGPVRGRTVDGVSAFLGVPYGGTTGGRHRFRVPQPPEPWAEVREATRYGPRCPQDPTGTQPEDRASFAGEDEAGEDCLVANVWTPGPGDQANRPVMLWLHGGGFQSGSAASPWCDGAALARRGDVVVVSINHRLGVLGFLDLEAFGGPDYAGSGLAGMLDIVLALEWVRDNIESFGGDPSNVTLFGESGGGRKISVLLGMPSAQGLFHRAIIQSGGHPRGIERDLSQRLGQHVFARFALEAGNIDALQRIPAHELVDGVSQMLTDIDDPALPASGRRMLFSPVVDGVLLPAHPFDPASPFSTNVPLIIGSNKDEAAWSLARLPGAGAYDEGTLEAYLARILGDRAPAVLAAHRAAQPEASVWDLLVSVSSEERRLLSIETAEQAVQRGGAPVYLYWFAWESDVPLLKAAHTMEIPFVFDTVDRAPITGTREDRGVLAEAMSETWIRFARSGDPNHAGIPHWAPYDLDSRPTMVFDVPPRLEHDPRGAERLAWGDLRPRLPWEEPAFGGIGPPPGIAPAPA